MRRRFGVLLVVGMTVGIFVGLTSQTGGSDASRVSAEDVSSAGFGNPVDLSQTCPWAIFFSQTTVATNTSGESVAAWNCSNGTIEAALESPDGAYTGPFVLGQGVPAPGGNSGGGWLPAPPQAAIDASGDVVIAWAGSGQSGIAPGPTNSRPLVVVTMQAGQTLSGPIQVSVTGNAQLGQLVMNSNGDAVLTWNEVNFTPGSQETTGYYSIMRAGGSFETAIPTAVFGSPLGDGTVQDVGEFAPSSAALNDSGDIILNFGFGLTEMQNWGSFGPFLGMQPYCVGSACVTPDIVAAGIDATGDVFAIGTSHAVGALFQTSLFDATLAQGSGGFGDSHLVWTSPPAHGTPGLTNQTVASSVTLATNDAGDATLAFVSVTADSGVVEPGTIEVAQGSALNGLGTPEMVTEVTPTGLSRASSSLLQVALDAVGNSDLVWTDYDAVTCGCFDAYADTIPALSTMAVTKHGGLPSAVRLVAKMSKTPAASRFLLAADATGVSIATRSPGRVVAVWGGKSCAVPAVQAAAIGQPLGGTYVVGRLSLSRTSGKVGTPVRLRGSTVKRDAVSLYWDGAGLGATTASGRGKFHDHIVVPASTGGAHSVIADDPDGGCRATATYSVRPSLTLSATSGAAGHQVIATVTGYDASQVVAVVWGSTVGNQLVPIVTGANGSGQGAFVVPSVRKGRYSVFAEESGGPSGSARFKVH